MSVARTILLKISDNQWLRANGTRLPFVRRAVSKFMPGESVDDMLAAASAMAGQGVHAVFTRLGENVKDRAEADFVARHYLDEIRTVQPHGPYLLGGWSMGGTVAFEIADYALAWAEKHSSLQPQAVRASS